MACTSFECETMLAAPRERVFAFLRYLPNHVFVHPMIVRIEALDELELREPVAGLPLEERSTPRRFRVLDRMRLGPLTLRFPYEVSLTLRPPGELTFEAYRFPGIRLHNTMTCTRAGAGTRLWERSEIEAPRLLIGTVRRLARAAHADMFAAIKRHLERVDVARARRAALCG